MVSFFNLLSDPSPSAMKYKHRSNETKAEVALEKIEEA